MSDSLGLQILLILNRKLAVKAYFLLNNASNSLVKRISGLNDSYHVNFVHHCSLLGNLSIMNFSKSPEVLLKGFAVTF